MASALPATPAEWQDELFDLSRLSLPIATFLAKRRVAALVAFVAPFRLFIAPIASPSLAPGRDSSPSPCIYIGLAC